MSSTRRRDPHIAWPLKVLAVAGVGAALFAGYDAATGGGSGDGGSGEGPGTSDAATTTVAVRPVARTGSEEVGPTDGAWAFGSFPASYEITYRVAFVDSARTEVLRVASPFDSRTVSHEGGSTAGAVLDQRELSFGVLATQTGDAPPTVVQVPPSIAGPRPAVGIEAAEEAGLAERREVREVAGRRCQVWRTGGALAATTFLPPSPEEHIDLCVDGEGLLLEEWQVSGGRAIRQRVATEVRVGPVEPGELDRLPEEATISVDQGGGSLRPIEATEQPPGPFLETTAATAPPGFTLRGRFSVVPPQPGLVEGGERGKVRAATTDVYVRGADAVIIERGGVLDLSDPWSPDDRFPDVDLGPAIGTGELVPGTSGAEVRALLGEGRYLRVTGSVDPETLVGVARSLTAVDDGGGTRIAD